jgi:hypothetical protein
MLTGKNWSTRDNNLSHCHPVRHESTWPEKIRFILVVNCLMDHEWKTSKVVLLIFESKHVGLLAR